MPDPRSFAGRTAVVTGAASGIGQATAELLSALGATVVGLDRTPTPGGLTVDISDAAAVKTAFGATGPIDVLVNAAGIREIASSATISTDEWDRVVAVNLSGTFYCCQAAATLAMPRGGAIVNVASAAGLIGMENRPAYVASKHAIVGLTKTLATDLAGRGIRVNVVCPGLVRTPLTESYFADAGLVESLPLTIPLGAAALPEDVAHAVAYLAGDTARMVTGVALPVDGGFLASKSVDVRGGRSAYNRAT